MPTKKKKLLSTIFLVPLKRRRNTLYTRGRINTYCHYQVNMSTKARWTPHALIEKATILRSEESVARATGLLGRTLRRASHAGDERSSLPACVPYEGAHVRERATASRSGHGILAAAAAAEAASFSSRLLEHRDLCVRRFWHKLKRVEPEARQRLGCLYWDLFWIYRRRPRKIRRKHSPRE